MTEHRDLKSCNRELEREHRNNASISRRARGYVLLLVVVCGTFTAFFGILLYQNDSLRAQVGARSTNYSGHFYTVLTYDTDNGGSSRLINMSIGYETYFTFKFNTSHPDYTEAETVEEVLAVFAGYCVNNTDIATLAAYVKGNCTSSDEEEVANALLSLCQDRGANSASIMYSNDSGDAIKYPVETVVEANGDCKAKTILFATVCVAVGIPVGIFVTTGHSFAGVALSSPPSHGTQGTAHEFSIGGVPYYVAETTGYGWRVGDLPPQIDAGNVAGAVV